MSRHLADKVTAEALLEPLGTGPLGIPLLADVTADTHWKED
jgi:hypothetical protein